MTTKKTTTMNLRVDPSIKAAIREAADREHRSVANMIEVLIRQHCQAVGISVPMQEGAQLNQDEDRSGPHTSSNLGALLRGSRFS